MIRILLEPLAGELLVNLLVVKNRLDRCEAVELIRTYTDGYSEIRYALRGSGIDEEGLSATSAERESFRFVTSMFFVPKPRVIVFGANPDAVPLVQMAASSGFRVVVADWRESFCNAERFPGVETIVAFPETLVEKLALNERDYVVIMSHQFEKDTAFFRGIMAYPLHYLGIMGSKERTAKMVEGFERPNWLHAPIGLNIGSEGAFENAISIVAELIAIKRGKHRMGVWSSPLAHGRDVGSFCSW